MNKKEKEKMEEMKVSINKAQLEEIVAKNCQEIKKEFVPKYKIAQATNKIIKCSLGKWYVGRTDGAPDEVVLLDDVLRIMEDLLNGKEKD